MVSSALRNSVGVTERSLRVFEELPAASEGSRLTFGVEEKMRERCEPKVNATKRDWREAIAMARELGGVAGERVEIEKD